MNVRSKRVPMGISRRSRINRRTPKRMMKRKSRSRGKQRTKRRGMRGGAEAQPFPEYPSDGKLRSKWPMMPENDYYYLIYTSCFRQCVVGLYSKPTTFIMVFYKGYTAIGNGNFQRKFSVYDELGSFEFAKDNMDLANRNGANQEIQFCPTQKQNRWSKVKGLFLELRRGGPNMDSLPRFTIRGKLQVNKHIYGAPDEPIETCIDFFPASETMLGSVSIEGYKGYAGLRQKLLELFRHYQVLALSTSLLGQTYSSVPAEIFHRIAGERIALCQVCCDPYQVEVSEHAQAAEETEAAAGEADAA